MLPQVFTLVGKIISAEVRRFAQTWSQASLVTALYLSRVHPEAYSAHFPYMEEAKLCLIQNSAATQGPVS